MFFTNSQHVLALNEEKQFSLETIWSNNVAASSLTHRERHNLYEGYDHFKKFQNELRRGVGH